MDYKELEKKIRIGEVDCNNQELFFSNLIKGLLHNLNKAIVLKGGAIPHQILNTGDDLVYLNIKGQYQSIEPFEVSNEDYVYNVVPRCIVTPHGISLESDQTSNPYSRGEFQIEQEGSLYTFSAEFRRLPIKFDVDLKYYVSTFTELLELTQLICTRFGWIRTFPIIYMGQRINCSYKIPDQFEGSFLTELDGTTQDNRNRTMEFSLELEANLPVFYPETAISNEHIITNTQTNISFEENDLIL